MMQAQASALVNLSDNVRREEQGSGGLQTAACLNRRLGNRRFLYQFVGQAFLPVALDSQGKRERLPYDC